MRRWLALVLLVAAAPAAAATFVAASVEELARTSVAVVRGRVSALSARPTPDGRIVTDVDVAVAAAWKGTPAGTLRVTVSGGSLGSIALHVDAAPTFAVGEDVVVFLARKGPAWRVNGWALGKYRVVGAEARPALGGARLLSRPLPPGERVVEPMSLAELERRVRSAR